VRQDSLDHPEQAEQQQRGDDQPDPLVQAEDVAGSLYRAVPVAQYPAARASRAEIAPMTDRTVLCRDPAFSFIARVSRPTATTVRRTA
jgi:hypothetical protein